MLEVAVIDSIKQLEEKLKNRYSDPALRHQTAWWMLEAISKKSKVDLIAHRIIVLNEQQQKALDNWIYQQVNQHMPLQYVLGSVPFDDIEILVEPPILIPRPETEEWCVDIINQLKKLDHHDLTILDLCSGSGCIALAIAKAFPDATIYAVDISPQAIALGQVNAQHNTISSVTFIESDLFKNLPDSIRFDLIVSNPPYIPSKKWQELDLSITKWEDPAALIAHDHGLEIIKQIIEKTPYHLKINRSMREKNIPQFVMEIDSPQAKIVANLLHQADFVAVGIKKDLEGKDRIVVGSVADVAITKDKQ